MKLLPLAIFVASIPAIISILLFLMRNKIASLRAGNGDEDTVKGAYDDRQNARDGVRLARLIPPSERPRSTPTSAQTEQRLSAWKHFANTRAVEKFIKDGSLGAANAVKIVKKSLEKGDLRWQFLLDELGAEAQNYELLRTYLTVDIYKHLAKNYLVENEGKVAYKKVEDIESASQCLVFGTWYVNIMKKADARTAPNQVKTWNLMGKVYTDLPKLLARPDANFQGEAQECFNKARNISSSFSKSEKGEAEIRNP